MSDWLLGVDRLPLVANLGDEAKLVVSGVGGCLDPAVRERDHELALHIAAGVLALRLLEVRLGDIVGHGVLVGEWLGDLLGLCIRLLG